MADNMANTQLLNYQDSGAEASALGNQDKTILLIHGLFGSGDNLNVIKRALEANCRVINVDLPDHGDSPHTQEFSFEIYANFVKKTLDALNIPSTNIVAHSLGGKVAMQFAYMYPEYVESLIILDIAPVAYEPRHHNVISGTYFSRSESGLESQTCSGNVVTAC